MLVQSAERTPMITCTTPGPTTCCALPGCMRDSCLWYLRCPLQALGVRKVALLFLTKTDLPHELTWRLWLEGAAGELPQQHLQAAQARPGPPLACP